MPGKDGEPVPLRREWKAVEGSRYSEPLSVKGQRFRHREHAGTGRHVEGRAAHGGGGFQGEGKKETKNPPFYNLAELQNDCSKMFKISPDETLKVVQELYEKKMVTHPRTDARVLSTAVSKEIQRIIGGLKNYGPMAGFAG